MHPPVPAGLRFLVTALLLAWLAQCALYAPTLRQLPFGDDWGPPLTEIARGERVGPLSFFAETRQPDSYRPVQSLLIWAFGRAEEPGRWPSIRALHFLSSGVAFVVLALLLRQWRFGTAGVVVAGLVAALHPSLVAPVGSIDGFSSVLSCAAVWWGVWMMGTTTRPMLGIAYACAALVVGTLVKEYAFAMTPMAVLYAWTHYRPRWRGAIVTGLVTGALTVLLLWARQFAKPTDMAIDQGDFALISPALLAANVGLVLGGGLFFGDSLWAFVERSPASLAAGGAVFAATMGLLVVGLWRRRAAQTSPSLLFLLLSVGAITFPANVVMKISEMYLCGLVFTVALLAALAADGLATEPSRARRIVAGTLAAAVAVVAVLAVRNKMNAMVALGVRARAMTDALVAEARGLPDGGSIALLFRKDQVPPRATFSSFRLPDCFLIRPPATEYLFPGRSVTLVCPDTAPGAPLPLLADEAAVLSFPRSIADVVLYWDVAAGRFTRLK